MRRAPEQTLRLLLQFGVGGVGQGGRAHLGVGLAIGHPLRCAAMQPFA